MARDKLLVVCTDGSPGEELFGPIQKYFREVIFLDRYLRDHSPTRVAVGELPRVDESVDALLAQLVASQARVFAGTLFSTFTGLIHRCGAIEIELKLSCTATTTSSRHSSDLRTASFCR